MQAHKDITSKSLSTFKTLESRLHIVHNNKYSYFFAIYHKSKDKALIACPTHGLFEQSFDKHLQGRGCPSCANMARGVCKQSNTTKFIEKAKEIHGVLYTYHKTTYGNNNTDLVIISCSKHGDFQQQPNSHLSGHGCDKCAELVRRRKFLDEPTILYYLHFHTSNVYKIGTTVERRGIALRYSADKLDYTVLSSKVYQTGEQAYNKEQEVLNEYSAHKYNGPNILIGGNSELFTMDVLKDQYDKTEQYFKDEGNW